MRWLSRGPVIVALGATLVLLAVLALVAFHLHGTHTGSADHAQVEPATQGADDPRAARLYGNRCAACHQADGSGIPGTFPPLAGHVPGLYAAEGGREYLIDVVLYGLHGEIRVDGRRYSGLMPPMPRMSDEEIAAALNHTLQAWSNADALPADFEPVTPAEIADRRGQQIGPTDVLQRRQALELD